MIQFINKKYVLSFIAMVLLSSYSIASGVVTTFTNGTQLDITLELHFSDGSMTKKLVSMAQSCQIVNFNNKKIDYVIFSSENKDDNGNMYGQLRQKFTYEPKNMVYILGLKVVPSYIVPAALGTEAFEMPVTQAITCTLKKDDI